MNPNNNQDDNQAGKRWAPGQNPFYTEPLNQQQPAEPQVPATQPEVYGSPSIPSVPYANQPAPQPQPHRTSSAVSTATGPNKLVIVAVAGVVLVIILGIVGLALSGGSKPVTNQQAQKTTQSPSMEPATALDLQQASNAIGQDISGADDEKDFPSNSLDTKQLNL